MAACALAAQVLVIYGAGNLLGGRAMLPLLVPASHLLLFPFLLANRRYWGMRLVLAGLMLNLLAMVSNGGLMPVEASAVEAVGRHKPGELKIGEPVPSTKNVFLEREDIRFRELSDMIVLPLPRPLTRAVSAGDLLVFPGVLLTFVEVVAIGRTSSWAGSRRSVRMEPLQPP